MTKEEMTEEEAIKRLKEARNTIQPFLYVDEAIDYVIKVLEQKKSTFDKIRVKIEQERVGYPPSADYYKAIMKCLQIIDKYKIES